MPPVPTLAIGAFMSAGITPRMFIMPVCGLFGGSGRLPVAQPIAAGRPLQVEARYLPPSMRSFTVKESSSATFSSSTALKNSVMPSISATNWSVTPASREALAQPPNTKSGAVGIALIALASSAAVSFASVKPPAGAFTATSSSGTFCATVIISCWSLAFGPSATSVTFDPGRVFASAAAS